MKVASPHVQNMMDEAKRRPRGGSTQGSIEHPASGASTARSLTGLLRTWYGDAKKKPPRTLTGATVRALAEAPQPDPAELDALAVLAQSDRTLEKTRHLLLLAVRMHRARVSSDLRSFAGLVLKQHPAFRTKAVGAVVAASPDAPDDAEAIELLATQDYSAISWPGSPERLKNAELRRCRTNAISCALVWLNVSGRISLESVLLIFASMCGGQVHDGGPTTKRRDFTR